MFSSHRIGISLFEVCVALFILSVAMVPLYDRMQTSILLTAQQQQKIEMLYARL